MKQKNKNIYRIVIVITILVTIFSGCRQTDNTSGDNKGETILHGTISISGAFALYPLTVRWAEEFQKLHSEVRIDISAGGAGKGMADALSGMVDLGMFSREVSREEYHRGAWCIAVAKDAVLPTINSDNPFIIMIKKSGISRNQLVSVFIENNVDTWEECMGKAGNTPFHIYTRSDACGAAEMFGKYLGGNQEKLSGTGVYGDPGMADAIKKDVYGIGYNNVIYVYDMKSRRKYDCMEVFPIDLNDNGMIDDDEDFYLTLDDVMNAIKENKYPSPPARDLYFVSKGKPGNKVVIAFLKWILTDGQNYVGEAGYVQLTGSKIDTELQKLE